MIGQAQDQTFTYSDDTIFLLWKGKAENFSALACEPLYGFQGKKDPSHIVLDGQQRLTALNIGLRMSW